MTLEGNDWLLIISCFFRYRDAMWTALKEQVLLMHEQVKEAEQDCSLFMMTMLPMYKYVDTEAYCYCMSMTPVCFMV
jgi:hypothetical protein